MRAVVTEGSGGPEVLSVAELPDPEPGPGEVLLDVAADQLRGAARRSQGGAVPGPGALPRLPVHARHGDGTIPGAPLDNN